MDAKVQNYNEIKHQDHAPHLKGKAKECYKRIELISYKLGYFESCHGG